MADNYWLGTTSGDLSASANWSTGSVPAAGDNIHFTATFNNPVTAGLTALNTATLSGALGVVIFEEGYTSAVGAAGGSDFQFTCTRFESYGTGQMYIDLEASAIAVTIHDAASAPLGQVGINIIGSALTTVNILGGNVGIAAQFGETASVNTLQLIGSNCTVYVGIGTTLTTIRCNAGTNHEIHCAFTTLTMYGGTLYTKEVGAVTTISLYGGTVFPESTGIITNLQMSYGGTADFTSSSASRTVTNLFCNAPGWSLSTDSTYVNITNFNSPSGPMTLQSSFPY